MNGAQAAVAALYEEGVRYMFGLPGTSEMPLVAAVQSTEQEIRYFLCLHEAVAVGMADGYTRAVHSPLAVANTHATQGTLNAIGFIRAAYRDGVPLLTLAGAPGSGYALNEPNHFLAGLPDVLSRVTKWTWQVQHPQQIASVIHRAVTLARVTPTGPASVLVTQDAWHGDAGNHVPSRAWSSVRDATGPSSATLLEILDLLAKARRPVVLAGRAVSSRRGVRALVAFSEAYDVPVIAESVDRGPMVQAVVFPADHVNFVGFFSSTEPLITDMLAGSDLLIILGAKATYRRVLGDWLDEANILQVDPDAWELGKNHALKLGVVADVAELLEQLTSHTDRPAAKIRVKTTQSNGLERRDFAENLTTETVVDLLAAHLDNDTIIVDDSQSLGYHLKRRYPFKSEETLFGSLASHLGWGLPSSLGVQVARPDERVVALLSDASFLLGPQGLWTAAKYSLPVIFVVINNRGFMSLRTELTAAAGAEDELGLTSLTDPSLDLAAMARSFGVPATTAQTRYDFEAALIRARRREGPVVIDAQLQSSDSAWKDLWYTPQKRTL